MTEPERDPTPIDTGVENATPEAEDDTEGHNLMTVELGQQMARERTREADKIEAQSRRRHELGKSKQPARPDPRPLIGRQARPPQGAQPSGPAGSSRLPSVQGSAGRPVLAPVFKTGDAALGAAWWVRLPCAPASDGIDPASPARVESRIGD